ncbi:hypothetical protein ABZ567_05560 [Streptomyces sp. NPDC016459]|uniref:hypothetical protein n=1 Tax=Streptomyces sp. NPDC016459 TaxID=3157190 RepID=UPI00340A21F5
MPDIRPTPPADARRKTTVVALYACDPDPAELLVREIRTALARPGLPADLHTRTGITLAEAARGFRAPTIRVADTLKRAQSRARLVDGLHGALDRTLAALPDPIPGP